MQLSQHAITDVMVGPNRLDQASCIVDESGGPVWEQRASFNYEWEFGDGSTDSYYRTVYVAVPDWTLAMVVQICGGGGGGQVGSGSNNTNGSPGAGGGYNVIHGHRSVKDTLDIVLILGSGGAGSSSNVLGGVNGAATTAQFRRNGVVEHSFEAAGGLRGFESGLAYGASSTAAPPSTFNSLYTDELLTTFRPNGGGVARGVSGRLSGSGVGGGGGEGGIFNNYTHGRPGSSGAAKVSFYGFREHTVT